MLRDPIVQNLFPEIFDFEEAVDVIGCLKEWPKSRLCDDKAIARKTKIDIKTVKDVLKLLETKKTYSQETLKTLNDNLNALIKGDKKENKKVKKEKADKTKEEAAEDDKKTINEDKESAEPVIKEEVEKISEESDEVPKAKKPKKESSTKKRAVNQKFWYLTFDEIIACLQDGYSTDEEISEKISCKLNIVRKILYKLYDMRLASYKRDKDKETQWYTYDWTFNDAEYKKLEFDLASSELKRLNEELDYEVNNMFFVCPYGHYRLDFEDASTVEFLCPECDVDLEFDDNQEKINRIKEEIRAVEEVFSN